MATQSNKRGLPDFFTDAKSAETVRRQFLEAPLEASRQSALGSAGELATLMSILPGAFVASQRRELNRIMKSSIQDDPRVDALQTSIQQAEVLQMMALRGQTRVQRGLVALANNEDVFHGFVSDADLAPMKGVTVRLSDSNARTRAFSATTDDDGYFSIPLGAKSDPKPDSGRKAKPISLSERLTGLLSALGQVPSVPPATDQETKLSQVEILRKGKVISTDPILVARDGGSIYREYAIADTEPSSVSDFRDFISNLSRKETSPEADSTKDTAEAVQASTTQAPASAKKRSRRNAKPIKSKSKK